MSTYRLDRLFAPRSVAVIGASPRPESLGRAVLNKIVAGGFEGRIDVVNPNHAEVEGIVCVPSLAALPHAPDVIVVATPKQAVPAIIDEAGARGTAAAVIITAGFDKGPGSTERRIVESARRTGLRLVGPDCMGVIAPRTKFDAGFAARPARVGDLALISQSGAIAGAMLEWAALNGAGFSGVLSLGDKVDVDFGDMLDFFAEDRHTRAVLVYVEEITNAAKFMSAARAAARVKPVVVVRAGRHKGRPSPPRTHSGALARPDAVYDAAFRRAGLLRVHDLDQMFAAAETLSRIAPFVGDRVTMLTNGGGLGRLAADRLVDLEGRFATLDAATRVALDAALPFGWSKANPVDIRGDADADTYARALDVILADTCSDAVLLLHSPTALASTRGIAEAVAATVKSHRERSFRPKPVFTVWAGDVGAAEPALGPLRVPTYGTEADAVRGLSALVRYRKAQEALLETPPSLPADFSPDVDAARAAVQGVLAAGRSWLDPESMSRLLAAYDIPTVRSFVAAGAAEAANKAEALIDGGFQVALKILSDDIPHKSEVGGVVLNLASRRAVEIAAEDMLLRVRRLRPEARIGGFVVQATVQRPHGRELIAGIADDSLFGPVIVFGRGGTAVEVIDDAGVALPPLDLKLARDMIARTRVSRQIEGYRGMPAADGEAVALTLVKLAQMAADLPEIRELDLNPLVADETGVVVLDARAVVAPVPGGTRRRGNPRFAVAPYPCEWERSLSLKDGTAVRVRPVRPEDEPLYGEFFKHITPEDLRLRFFAPVKDFNHAFIARLTQIDYARAMAFAALDDATGELLGVVRLHTDANRQEGEYAILLRSDLKGRGLGWALMRLIIEYAKADGLARISGQILRENTTMLAMVKALGFDAMADPDEPELRKVTLDLTRVDEEAEA